MLLKSFEFAGIAFGITLVIALLVAGIIKLIYITVHKWGERGKPVKQDKE